MKTAVVIDDHPFVRAIVRELLSQDGIEVTAEAGDGIDAFAPIREFSPDLLVLDIDMPRLGGFELMERLPAETRPKVLMLSAFPAQFYAARCVNAGASGYVCKEGELADFSMAVAAIRSGYVYFPQVSLLPQALSQSHHDEASCLRALTAREYQIFRYLSLGMSNKVIGEHLEISSKTVSSHKSRLLAKFRVGSVVDLALIAERHKVV